MRGKRGKSGCVLGKRARRQRRRNLWEAVAGVEMKLCNFEQTPNKAPL